MTTKLPDFCIIPVIDQGYWSYIYIDSSINIGKFACNESIRVFDWNHTHKV